MWRKRVEPGHPDIAYTHIVCASTTTYAKLLFLLQHQLRAACSASILRHNRIGLAVIAARAEGQLATQDCTHVLHVR